MLEEKTFFIEKFFGEKKILPSTDRRSDLYSIIKSRKNENISSIRLLYAANADNSFAFTVCS